MTDLLSSLASLATAAGALCAAWQLWHLHRQSVTSFEDDFGREYRELAHTLPLKALLGEELSEEEYRGAFKDFYHYFDLCLSPYLGLSSNLNLYFFSCIKTRGSRTCFCAQECRSEGCWSSAVSIRLLC